MIKALKYRIDLKRQNPRDNVFNIHVGRKLSG